MMTPELLSLLLCPTCQAGSLRPAAEVAEPTAPEDAEDGQISCVVCGATYPIRLGFPILIPHAALTGHEWTVWREHLEKFQARREARIRNPAQPITKLAEKSQPQPPFAEFTRIKEGRLLDIGCGPGKFRLHFDPSRVEYFGLDPLALPEVHDFPFVQGLAEYIPFKDGTFTDVVVLAALDHFRDLDRFFSETRRVLIAGGRLHILQSVHQMRGPVSAIRVLAHKVKDGLEQRETADHGRNVPKHLTEFTDTSLVERTCRAGFDLADKARYSATWYSPEKLFLSFTPSRGADSGLLKSSRRPGTAPTPGGSDDRPRATA